MKKQIIFAIAILMVSGFFFSCCRNSDNECATEESCCTTVSADSLAMLWNNAWNTKNLEALKGMIADSALVMDHEMVIRGKDSIIAKWITPGLPVISNVTTTPLKTLSCCCCVSLTGLYMLDYQSGDKTVPARGNFTFTWIKQEDKSYKLEMMHLTEFHDDKTGN
jgi:ketosteroid isomerase-like protein